MVIQIEQETAGLICRAPSIIRELLCLGRSLGQEGPSRFRLTRDAESDAFLKSDGFHFLVGVICQYAILSEDAWTVPYKLCLRLGHLDPELIAMRPRAVYRAFRKWPALHRNPRTVARWVVQAAEKVLRDFGGQAELIWAARPTAGLVCERLQGFAGIGQKKSAIAVQVLVRDFSIPISGLSSNDIGYDVHIRRVLLRTGLACRDELNHMLEVIRKLHPEWPGALHRPLWYVGRHWCHRNTPECTSCVLSRFCEKKIRLGSSVRGA